ncbi:MAG: tycC2, partial [Armatimonadetes bacterium]|nr:tycC2 [Armatimonadota bacterium]
MGVQDSPTRLDAVVRGYLQSGWEDGGELIIPSEPLHALIEARARRHPEREAVLGGGSGLSYRELTVRADQIARLLLARGVQTEDRVAVCLPRTPELVAVLLGILKAGACYVPLDAAYPRERLELMLRSSGAALLLTDSSLLPGLPESEARPLLLDQLPEPHGADHPPAPFPTVHPGQLANVIYTSGSTGVPKGVAIEHRSVAALAAWAGRLYSPAELAGVLAGTSICFDLSVFELFVTLCCGGTVVLAANALGLKDLPERDRVTLVNTVPSAIKELARVGGIPPGVLTINLAGEALSPELVDLLYATTGVERVYDLYGPTEDTVYSTCALRLPHSAATIGRPLPGTRAYVLDADLQPPAPGEAGELYLGGAGLARGYLHRPDLTHERFVSCPVAGAPDERVYRTGDLVRRLPDGQLEYLGRLDQQVKIRGYRIELGDIEAAIRRQPGIRDTVVTAPESATGDRRLVAYVVWEAGEPGELSSLRRALGDSLPGYMLPEALVTLDRIPLTPNGKIDRRALPLPAVDDTPGEHLAPRTELEAALARIWSRVLGREAVGIHDDFFDQGGHSLLAMRVLQQIQQELSLDPPVRLLFEERTVAGLAAALAQLPPAATTASLPLPQAAEERVPASAQQEALWFLEQLYPGQNGYNIPIVLRLSGPVDGAALAKCLQELVARHPLLRSRLAADASGVGLEFTSVPDTVLVYADLESVPAPQRGQAARQAALQVCDPPFDLSVAPLFRAQLLRLGETEWRLVLCIHHAVADGLSIELLLRELGVLYNARKAGHATPLAEMAAGYPDYCRWQGEQLRGDALRTQRSYWKQQLAGLDPVLAFPADRPRPAHFTAQGGRVRSTVSARTVQRVEALARRQKVTLFMVLLAAFAVLLQRYSQQEELGVGTPVAGRSRPEFEGVFGYFVNTLPLRIDCTGDPSFAALLRRVRETCTGAFGHADLPFAQIVEALEVPRDPSRAPLTQAWLTLQDEPAHLLQLRGIEAELLPVDPGTAKVDLLLMLERSDGEIQATLEYYASVTAPETATRFLEQFVRLLEALDTAAEQPLSRLPLLSEAETTRVTRTWNETRTPYPAESVHRLFEAQVRRTPEAAALVSEEGTVSYAELNERANRMARWLQANGAVTGDLVGIYLPRSAELVAVLLGILKAGAAYLPLDLASPPERLRMMLAEAGAPLVVTSTSLAAALGEPDCRVLQIDGPEANLAAYAVGNLDLDAAPDDLAYVMFTSGSSGKPKGVEIPHRAIARLVFGVDYCAFGPAETHLLLAPVSFDASTFELWGALLHGGRCALFPDALPTLEALGAALRDYEVTTLWLTASLFNFVIDEEPELLGGLRRLLTGGEALSVPHVRRALDLLPHLQLVNGYGPTEGTTFTCCFPIPRPLSDYCSVPLGSPLANTRVYVLDRSLQPVPIGVAGELYIAGDGLARGYLNDAELTARRFVKLTIAGVTERAYRSGDLARWRADGTLEFLGRADRQVKIRGHRIEPGEIEAQLGQCAEVAASVVLVQPGAGGEPELRAYVVPRPGPPPDETALLARLAQRLPAYLVPGRIAFVRRLPLT